MERQDLTFCQDDYFKMSKADKQFGKEAKYFWGLKSTQKNMEALREMVGNVDLFFTTRGQYGGI